MQTFVGHPTYRSQGIRYTAPSVFVEAQSHDNAMSEIKRKSGLSRFSEWSFFVVKFTKSIKQIQFEESRRKKSTNEETIT